MEQVQSWQPGAANVENVQLSKEEMMVTCHIIAPRVIFPPPKALQGLHTELTGSERFLQTSAASKF